MLCIPRIHDEDICTLSEALHAISEGLIVDVVDFNSVEGLYSELAKTAGNSLG
jgi:hypothetical protein